MKYCNRLRLLGATFLIPLLGACYDSQIHVDNFQPLSYDVDLNNPGVTDNIATPIIDDHLSGANYLRNHVVSLLYHDKNATSNFDNAISGTGFIINIFQNSPHGITNAVGSIGDVRILVGTNFHVAQALFPDVDLNRINQDNYSPSLNDPERQMSIGFLNYIATQEHAQVPSDGDYSMYFTSTNRTNLTNNVNNRFLGLEDRNVKLVYAATNLSLNKEIFNFDNRISQFNNYKNIIIEQKYDQIEWVDSFNPALNNPFQKSLPNAFDHRTEYKFATDFAVLEIKIPNSAFNTNNYLNNLFTKMRTTDQDYSALNVSRGFVLSPTYTTNYFVTGAFSKFDSEQIITEKLQRSRPIFRLKQEFESDRPFPSVINANNFFDYIEVLNLNDDVQVVDPFNFNYDDVNGVLSFHAYLENKVDEAQPGTKIRIAMKRSNLVYGLKATNTQTQIIAPAIKTTVTNDVAVTKWSEAYVKRGVFSDISIARMANSLWNDQVYNKVSLNQKTGNHKTNLAAKYNLIQHHDDVFLGIDSEFYINNLNLKPGSSGALAISDGWNLDDKIKKGYSLVGIYRGINQWHNPFTNQVINRGVYSLFSSPLRYELFQAQNKLSKPSLCDVIALKNLGTLSNEHITCPVVDN